MIPIYLSRIDPRDPNKRQQWQAAEGIDIVTFDTPHGKVSVQWDEENSVMKFIGRELQLFHTVGNVIDIDVIQDREELP
jgi:hypothetical protein